MSLTFRTELVAENAIFGAQQAVWKERLWGKSVVVENIRTVAFTTGESQRMLCVGHYIQSSERQASGTVLRLPARELYWCWFHSSSAFWSECTASSLRTINACELFHAYFNALFYSAHHNIFILVSALQKIQNETDIKMRSVTTQRLKKSAKRGLKSPQKLDSIGITWFQESNLFHQCRINFYQTHTCSSLLLTFTTPLAISVTVHVIAQKITDNTHVKSQWAERNEVWRYIF
jgi:hypothetical protein